MKTIEIAPSLKNTHIIKDTTIVGRLQDGSRTYVYMLPEGFTFGKKHRNEYKRAFSAAIALASKLWQAEDALNNHFGGYGQANVQGKLHCIEGPAPALKPNKIIKED